MTAPDSDGTAPRRVGDLATEVAQRLQEEHLDAIMASGEAVVDEEEPLRAETRRSIFAKIEFRWRTSDERILDQIRAAVDAVFGALFDEAITAMDELYAEMRVPDTNQHGVVLRDSRGRVVWKLDERGLPVEEWGQLTGQDIEKCLLDVARVKLTLAPQLNDLLLEAVFAKHIAEDAHHDAFVELLDETIPGRNAHASRKARPDKYHAFFRYYLYSHADAFMREVSNFARVLDRVLYLRIQREK